MTIIRLILLATMMNLRSLPNRRTSSLVLMISIAGVVAVFSGVLAMRAGLSKSMQESGRSDRVIVLRAGSTAEIASAITRDELLTVQNTPGVKSDARGISLVSGEAVAPLTLVERGTGLEVNGVLRGIGPQMAEVRPEIAVVQGRMFERGKFELVVGVVARAQFESMDLNREVEVYGAKWKIVGTFSAAGSYRESELMTDADTIMGASQRPAFQNVTVILESPESWTAFKDSLTSNPSLAVDAFQESDFLERESKDTRRLFSFIAYFMGGVMALGAVFVAINATHTSIDDRRREIATLRALGFPSVVVVVSLMAEILLLAVASGIFGATLVWFVLNGNTMNTTIGGDSRLLAFQIALSVPSALAGIGAAVAVGATGGVYPIVRCLKSSVATNLGAV